MEGTGGVDPARLAAPLASGDVMTSLIIGTVLFAASVLAFGLAFYLMRSPRPGKWAEAELMISLICVGITMIAALAMSTYVAAAASWKATMAANSAPTLAGYALVDLAALVVAAALVIAGRRRGRVMPVTGLGEMPTGGVPHPANTPSKPRARKAA
jgi:hypothetical protein